MICDSSKYEAEVNRQLEDLSSYFPSSQYQYDERIDKLKYEVSRFVKIFPEELQISKIMPTNYSPASFYILPKIHKEFQDFPKGRPISSTCKTINKPFSQLLDLILQPVMNFIPNLIIDTTHFLILLDDVKLDPSKSYKLVTADIESIYPNLNKRKVKESVVIL